MHDAVSDPKYRPTPDVSLALDGLETRNKVGSKLGAGGGIFSVRMDGKIRKTGRGEKERRRTK